MWAFSEPSSLSHISTSISHFFFSLLFSNSPFFILHSLFPCLSFDPILSLVTPHSWETKDSVSHRRGRESSTLHCHEVIRKGEVWLQCTRGLSGGKWTLKSQSLLDSVLKTWHKQEKGDAVPLAFSRCTILKHPYVVGVRGKKRCITQTCLRVGRFWAWKYSGKI